MNPASKPRWQQAAALVSLGAGGAVTGFSFIPGTVTDAAAPPITQIRLLALRQAARAQPSENKNGMLRSAIVNVSQYYLRLAASKTPAEMEALIWQRDSPDGVDHGQSCAAFASLTLELAAQVVGQQSWVTGGSTYPWPLHDWAEVRVDPNPDSLQIMSVLQDARAQHRWRPLGDGYQPQPGDWVMFDGHVEVVTSYASGVLDTIGGDSLPDFSVNAHQYGGPLAAQGVTGFVNNGDLADAAGKPGAGAAGAAGATGTPGVPGASAPAGGAAGRTAGSQPAIPGAPAGGSASTAAPAAADSSPRPGGTSGSAARSARSASPAGSGQPASTPAGSGWPSSSATVADAAVPGASAPVAAGAAAPAAPRTQPGSGTAIPGLARPPAAAASAAPKAPVRPKAPSDPGTPKRPEAQGPAAASAIPGVPATVASPAAPAARAGAARPAASGAPYGRHQPTAAATSQQGSSQQSFISAVAAGAVAAQRRYGVPAAVTIAQAIDESAWGQSVLASRDHNLFGIKGIGPAGSDRLPTQEYVNGQAVIVTSSFRVYRSDAESIDDHGRLLATSGYYRQAMSYRQNPNAFAAALTGVYATDPHYGAKIISLMSEYDLYQYDSAATASAAKPTADLPGSAGSAIPGLPAASPTPAPSPTASSSPTASPPPAASPPASTPAPPTSPAPPAPTPPAATPPTATPPAPTPTPSAPASPAPTPTPSAPGTPAPTPTSARPGSARIAPSRRATRRAPARVGPADPATGPGSSGASAASAADAAGPGAPVTPAAASSGTRPAGAAIPSVAATSQASAAAVPGAPPVPGGSAAPAGPMTADIPATSAAPTAGYTAAAVSSPAPRARAARRGPGLLSDMARPFARATRAGAAPAGAVAAQAAPAGRPTAPARPARTPAAQPSGPRRPTVPPPAPRRPAGQRPAAQPPAGHRPAAQGPGAAGRPSRYRHQMPASVTTAFLTSAQLPLLREEPLYRDVAGQSGIRWELLAGCDWMQCRARPRFSPVHGEKLGATNSDGTVYRTRSEALEQCAEDLADLAWAVYRIDVCAPGALSVRDLANVYAAFRWGGLLKLHRTSAMEFPYSVAGLTGHLLNMRWPNIAEPNAPDRPGTRFRMPFGAVPVVLSLDYPAIA